MLPDCHEMDRPLPKEARTHSRQHEVQAAEHSVVCSIEILTLMPEHCVVQQQHQASNDNAGNLHWVRDGGWGVGRYILFSEMQALCTTGKIDEGD